MRPIIYKPADRPEVEVDVDCIWYYGVLRMWTRDDAGAWSAQVTWSRATGEHLIDTFPASRVRRL